MARRDTSAVEGKGGDDQWHRNDQFERWYGENYRRLVLFALRRTGSPDGAQQALVDALRRCSPHMHTVAVDAWWTYVTTAVARAASNWRRAEQRHLARTAVFAASVPSGRQHLGERFDDEVVAQADLEHCLDRLPALEQRIARLKMEGFVDREIADALGIGPDAVFRRVKSARRLLAACLEEQL